MCIHWKCFFLVLITQCRKSIKTTTKHRCSAVTRQPSMTLQAKIRRLLITVVEALACSTCTHFEVFPCVVKWYAVELWNVTGRFSAAMTRTVSGERAKCSTETKQCVRCLRRVEFVYKLSFSRSACARTQRVGILSDSSFVAVGQSPRTAASSSISSISSSFCSPHPSHHLSERPASSVGLRRRSGQKDVLPIGPRASRSAGWPGRPVTVAPTGAINHGWLSASSCDAAAQLPLRRCLFINRSTSVSPILDLHCLWPALPCRRLQLLLFTFFYRGIRQVQ